jgi:flavodoxin
MRTYTVTFTENQFLLLKEIFEKKVKHFRDSEHCYGFTFPEIFETKSVHKLLNDSQPNERKENHG